MTKHDTAGVIKGDRQLSFLEKLKSNKKRYEAVIAKKQFMFSNRAPYIKSKGYCPNPIVVHGIPKEADGRNAV